MKLSVAVLLILIAVPGQAQTSGDNLTPGYYVVVASFSANQKSYSESYSVKLNNEGKHAASGFDAGRKFYHVYLDRYSDFKESIQQMYKARREGFATAWVRIIIGNAPAESASAPVAVEKNEKSIVRSAPAVPSVASPVTAVADADRNPPTVAVAPPAPPVVNPAPADVVKEAPVAAEVLPAIAVNDPLVHPALLRDNTVIMTLFNPTKNTEVDGDVEIVDGERAKLLTRVKSNEPVLLPDPKNSSGRLLLKATSFGYRPQEHALNYKATEKDSLPDFIDVENAHYRLRFEMVRLRLGDIAVLYNVYFYNDAAVMIADSKYELNKLLELMNSNKNYRIKLHGHTNGGGHGKIISLGADKNFFSLSGDVKQGFGSAKELSKQRAETIRDWLIANGVAPSRIEVQAHGGNRMIHDKNGASAKKNVRVEVEMLSE